MPRGLAVLGAVLLSLVLVPSVPATAGGGCHGGVTQGTGDTVNLIDACFTPTILRIDPGAWVTFVNQDPFVHNVTANLWGHFEDLAPGDAFTATFAEEGLYPYACTYHPGMAGVVVVGDGEGPGSGEAVSVASSQAPPPPSPEVRVETVTVTEDPGASSPVVWLAAGIGLLVGVAIGWRARRRRAVAAAEPA